MQDTRTGSPVLSASTLTGNKVRNPSGDDLGKVQEIMLDTEFNRIAYVVVSFGGFLGLGDKLFAIPWEAMALDTDEHAFILDVDREQLEAAPGFDKDNWPLFADRTWGSNVYTHYGAEPYW
jgi:sporulation protein YlmC with PRC-barrel domain